MFIGHYGIAFALKAFRKNVSLGLLFIAVQFVDVLWGVFVLGGLEIAHVVPGITAANPLELVHVPYSHGLAASFVWAGGVYTFIRFLPTERMPHRGRVALVMSVAVLSHFLLDFIVHRPDLPLLDGGSPKVGLGLWNYALAAYAVEAAILLTGLALYMRSTASASRVGRYGPIAFGGGLLFLNAFSMFGPPLEPVESLVALLLVLFVLLALIAHWLDRRASGNHPRVLPVERTTSRG